MGKPFDPSAYPVGTRVRIVSEEPSISTWDVRTGITVLGVAR